MKSKPKKRSVFEPVVGFYSSLRRAILKQEQRSPKFTILTNSIYCKRPYSICKMRSYWYKCGLKDRNKIEIRLEALQEENMRNRRCSDKSSRYS
jgi:hypothetical protein